ncbi:50S ribosomal protein L44e [Candidatus Bathyarchaeota archaeon]|nr:50S ribosomal protein L44e [Candidatus Bathyarchaeota archaeon]
MKAPKTLTTFCPKCNKHTDHSLSMYRKGHDRPMAAGNRRSLIRKRKGYGGQRDPRQRKTAKTTKKATILMRCAKCGYKLVRTFGRLRKLDLST